MKETSQFMGWFLLSDFVSNGWDGRMERMAGNCNEKMENKAIGDCSMSCQFMGLF